MSNMSYCRFENTLRDMEDCVSTLNNAGSVQNYVTENQPSEYEMGAIRRMREISNDLIEALHGVEYVSIPEEEDV